MKAKDWNVFWLRLCQVYLTNTIGFDYWSLCFEIELILLLLLSICWNNTVFWVSICAFRSSYEDMYTGYSDMYMVYRMIHVRFTEWYTWDLQYDTQEIYRGNDYSGKIYSMIHWRLTAERFTVAGRWQKKWNTWNIWSLVVVQSRHHYERSSRRVWRWVLLSLLWYE